MKIYNLRRKQVIPISRQEAWKFFSSPENLNKITPPEMGFSIRYISGENKTYAGQIIAYQIKILPGLFVNWVTEISHVIDQHYFVDEQRMGPYAFWHHQHHFNEIEGGTEITDEVNYAIPLGVLGRLAHWLFVGRKVNAIFDYRYAALTNFFSKN
ncbi:MAG: SRPBCC family protein [Flammeovirgaceae bacterium]|nr:SRPBCC family protein [Flammeovirgaceae bacterium]